MSLRTLLKALMVLLLGIVVYQVQDIRPSEQQLHDATSNKVFLVCGASSGIGEQIAYLLTKLNSKVIIVARSAEKLEKVKNNAVEMYGSDAGFRISVYPCDLSSYEAIQHMVISVKKFYGRVDHLILNHAVFHAGLFTSDPQHQDPQFIEKVYRTNVFGNIQITLGLLEELENRSGHILVSSSAAGELPTFLTGLHGSSKHALNGFFYSLQQELLTKRSSVTVSVAALGIVLTKDVTRLMDNSSSVYVPDLFKGDVEECAMLMVENFVTRANTLSYPRISLLFGRLMWWFNPFYNHTLYKLLIS